MPEHPKFNSRYCNRCETYWPYTHQHTACPVCDVPTQAKSDVHDFESIAKASVVARARLQSKVSHEIFEAYYEAKLRRVTDWEITKLNMASPATMNSWLLHLTESVQPTKEVADGGTQS